jgi:tetratricopeptide (TPR) repeat protein
MKPERAAAVSDPELLSGSEGKGAHPALHPWAAPGFVVALTFLTYAVSLRFGFVYDDRVQIVANPWLASWRFVPRYFAENIGAFTGQPGSGFWRPLFLLWLLANRSLFGLAPWGWHLTTVGLHCAAAVLLYVLARRLLRDRFLASVAALLFGVYPATVETAAWISGATDSLLCVFLLGSLLWFLRAEQRPSRLELGISLLIYALALLVKETAVILPALVLAHTWPSRYDPEDRGSAAKFRHALRAVLPYLAVTAVYVGVRALVLVGAQRAPLLTGTAAMAMTWPAAIWFYLRLLFFPNIVSPHYDLKVITNFGLGAVLLPAAALIALAVGVWLALRRVSYQTRRAVCLALAWIIAPLVPVLYLRPLAPDDFVHIRYLYISTIGLGLLAATVISKLRKGTAQLFGRPAAQVAVAVGLLAIAGLATAKSEIHWANNYTLFAHAAQVAPGNPRALTNLAIELGERQRYEEAVDLFERALRINSRLWYAAVDLGYTFDRMGRYQDAERWMSRAVDLWPQDPGQYTYLAAVEIKLGKLDKAEETLRKAIERAPRRPGSYYTLGLLLERETKLDEAIQAYRVELANDPANQDARRRLEQLAAQR